MCLCNIKLTKLKKNKVCYKVFLIRQKHLETPYQKTKLELNKTIKAIGNTQLSQIKICRHIYGGFFHMLSTIKGAKEEQYSWDCSTIVLKVVIPKSATVYTGVCFGNTKSIAADEIKIISNKEDEMKVKKLRKKESERTISNNRKNKKIY